MSPPPSFLLYGMASWCQYTLSFLLSPSLLSLHHSPRSLSTIDCGAPMLEKNNNNRTINNDRSYSSRMIMSTSRTSTRAKARDIIARIWRQEDGIVVFSRNMDEGDWYIRLHYVLGGLFYIHGLHSSLLLVCTYVFLYRKNTDCWRCNHWV